MAGGMRKVTVQPPPAKCATGRRIHIRDFHPRPNRVDGLLLCLKDSRIYLSRRPRWTADMHGPGPVGTIASEYNTEVADHESVARNEGLRGPTVRQCRALACGDNGGERHAFRPFAARFVLHSRRNLDFPHSGTNLLERSAEKPGPEFYGKAKQANLDHILHHPDLFHQHACGCNLELRPDL